MVWWRSLPKSNPVGSTRPEQAAGAAGFATECPPAPGQKKHDPPTENTLFLTSAKIRPTWIRHAANLHVWLWGRAETIPATNRTQRFSSAAVPPPKDPHLDSRYSGPWFPQPRALFFFTPGGPSMASLVKYAGEQDTGSPKPPQLVRAGCQRRGLLARVMVAGRCDRSRLGATLACPAAAQARRGHGWPAGRKKEKGPWLGKPI